MTATHRDSFNADQIGCNVTLLFRDNGKPINPLDTNISPRLRQIFAGVREKKYMIDGDENKLVVVV